MKAIQYPIGLPRKQPSLNTFMIKITQYDRKKKLPVNIYDGFKITKKTWDISRHLMSCQKLTTTRDGVIRQSWTR